MLIFGDNQDSPVAIIESMIFDKIECLYIKESKGQ